MCGSALLYVLRCGSGWFSDIVKPMVSSPFQEDKQPNTAPHRTIRKTRTVKNPCKKYLKTPSELHPRYVDKPLGVRLELVLQRYKGCHREEAPTATGR